MGDKPCKRSADTEVLISDVTDGLQRNFIITDLGIQKSTRNLHENSETLLLQLKPILESLDSDIGNSLQFSPMNMHLSRSSYNSTTDEETDNDAESSSSTSPEKTGTVAKENLKECLTCNYFEQIDLLHRMQLDLLDIRRNLGKMAKDLLVLCNRFNSCDLHKIAYVIDLFNRSFNDIIKETEMKEDFEQGSFFRVSAGDPIGAVRLSSEIMNHKLLFLENEKIPTDKTKCRAELTLLIEEKLESKTPCNNALKPVEQVLIALRFYAVACMQLAIADLFDVSQPTVCRVVHRVSEAIASLLPDFIHLPVNREECKTVSRKFFSIVGFPKVIGALMAPCTYRVSRW
ncbi:nuclease HARBI1 [Trichonephila clavipes]|nr:nuclease HARBI1 [Trichonephila clavipes]